VKIPNLVNVKLSAGRCGQAGRLRGGFHFGEGADWNRGAAHDTERNGVKAEGRCDERAEVAQVLGDQDSVGEQAGACGPGRVTGVVDVPGVYADELGP
jgi:hypothetical protein